MNMPITPLPSREAIAGYWNTQRPLGMKWEKFPADKCWRCFVSFSQRGESESGNRCHIVPSMLGGSDSKENLILLCNRCHREAPDVPDPEFIWYWIEHTRFEDSARIAANIFHVYELIFGQFPIPAISEAFQKLGGRATLYPSTDTQKTICEADIAKFVAQFVHELEAKIDKVGFHSGCKPSTLAWAMSAAIERIKTERIDATTTEPAVPPIEAITNVFRKRKFLFEME